MKCISTIEEELESTGYMVNQTRMWYASHNSLRKGTNWNESEDYMFKHLIDGSRFANRLGWQWVMGSQTGKPYGFSKFQVEKRAPELCNNCQLKNNCPIQEWPQTSITEKLEIDIDLHNERIFGPQFTIENEKSKPSFVWITGESLGDGDPAVSYYNELPIVFIFDVKLLNKLQLSTKRINFILDCLKEINDKKELEVHLTDPKEYLNNKNFASTFAPVPKYREITKRNIPSVEFPAPRLVEPINFYPSSYSSWKKKIKLKV
jgi:deoxyribodipyrimidine photo-lyase